MQLLGKNDRKLRIDQKRVTSPTVPRVPRVPIQRTSALCHNHGRCGHVRLHGGRPAVAAGTVHDFTVMDIDKKPVDLSTFAGKAVLIVNVASA